MYFILTLFLFGVALVEILQVLQYVFCQNLCYMHLNVYDKIMAWQRSCSFTLFIVVLACRLNEKFVFSHAEIRRNIAMYYLQN